jgi:hypothetical protein
MSSHPNIGLNGATFDGAKPSGSDMRALKYWEKDIAQLAEHITAPPDWSEAKMDDDFRKKIIESARQP